jgi:DNA-binding XRE family transcriptional regulator
MIEFSHLKSRENKHMTRVEMTKFLGTTNQQMQGMLEGHYNLNGWTTKEFGDKQKTHLWANRGAKLVIERDGQQLTGTRTELAKKLGVSSGTVSAFAQGRYKTCKGWVLVRQIDD